MKREYILKMTKEDFIKCNTDDLIIIANTLLDELEMLLEKFNIDLAELRSFKKAA